MALRAAVLREEPLCRKCSTKRIVRASREVDHIIPLHKGGTDARENLQGLCIECHKEKTLEERGVKVRPTIGLDGWPQPSGGG